MKAYKLTFIVVDFENHGLEEILSEFENIRHFTPSTLDTQGFDIGEWTEDHPLNRDIENRRKYIMQLELQDQSKQISFFYKNLFDASTDK